MSEVGALIASERSQRGLRQEDLARLIGLTGGSQISKYERGELLPQPRTVSRMEEAMDISDGRLAAARGRDIRRRRDPLMSQTARQEIRGDLHRLVDGLDERQLMALRSIAVALDWLAEE